jgi:2-oxoglutarate dehydrogenase E2 component (dihydrolipoamide succinyltransferase)
MIEVRVPELGESIQEVQVAQWLKQEGQWVNKDEDLVELETEKASQALPAPDSGMLTRILVATGEFARVGTVLATLDPEGKAPADSAQPADRATSGAEASPADGAQSRLPAFITPAARRHLAEHQIDPSEVRGTGPGGRILKQDVERLIEARTKEPATTGATATSAAPSRPSVAEPPAAPAKATPSSGGAAKRTAAPSDGRVEVRPMSMLRRTIASRLVEAQRSAALLTTFNEVDMQPVIALRNKYKDAFLEKHHVKLGFMSFFAKASVEALRRFPAVNAEVRGTDIVYHHYCDIGIAIGSGKGLVVPVLRDVERMSFAEIEQAIGHFAERAQAGKLTPDDLAGGTFTISNGGVYGSLLSTPIVNPPQSGILGLHAIQDRPVARDGQVVIRPMMYVALTYDHRIVDGREAVTFLKTIKEVLEEPARLFLEV